MNRLITPSADTMAASEPLSLRQELIKADQAQQQRFEQALRLGSAQQKRAQDHKDLPGNPIGKRDEYRRAKPDAPLANNKVADKERELTERRLARQVPRSKTQHDRQEGNDRQALQPLPETLPQIHEDMLAPTVQQGRESLSATGPKTRDCVDKHTAELPMERHPLANSDSRPVAADPSTQERVNEHPVYLPLAMPNEALIRRELSEQPKESSELAARFEAGERLQTTDEPAEQLSATSEEELLAQESFVGSAIRVPPLTVTPGDLLLARVAPPVEHHELGQLLSRLAVDIQLEVGRPDRPPLLQLTLPALGELAIRIERHQGTLQVEILASEQGQLLLNQGRGELIDRLQRLYPGERVAFDLFTRGDSEQGSRQKRSIYDEWDADA